MSPKPFRFGCRWTVCALLFAATTINYMDRQVLGILAPVLQRQFGWSDAAYGDIVSWFSLTYALGFVVVGRWLDRIGVRRGYALAAAAWSLAAVGHALARTMAGFSAARAFLGLAESANFPGAIKAVAEWFPKSERALATGIFNAGANTGAILTPLVVPWLAVGYGWQSAFIVTGALGLIWVLCWVALYRSPGQHSSVTRAELAYIRGDAIEAEATVPWLKLLRYRQTWAFAVGKFLTDPVWWFYLYWLPKFLDARRGVDLRHLTLPLIAVYLVADGGSVLGGWFSSALIKRGVSVYRSRKSVMLIAACFATSAAFVPHLRSLSVTVLFVAVAAAAHTAWSANIFTIASDMFPRTAVASVVGIGGFAGAIGGVLFQRITGYVLQANGGHYGSLWTCCAFAYITGWCVIHWLTPRLEAIDVN